LKQKNSKQNYRKGRSLLRAAFFCFLLHSFLLAMEWFSGVFAGTIVLLAAFGRGIMASNPK
jgi:hypothetical protein